MSAPEMTDAEALRYLRGLIVPVVATIMALMMSVF